MGGAVVAGAASSAPTSASPSPVGALLAAPSSSAPSEKGPGGEGNSGTPTPEDRLNSRIAAGGGEGQNGAKSGTDAKLQEATREWEAFFVGYLLKQMRKTAGDGGGGLFKPSEGEKMFRDMLDDETARSMSKTGGLGLADMLNRELGAAHARAEVGKGNTDAQ